MHSFSGDSHQQGSGEDGALKVLIQQDSGRVTGVVLAQPRALRALEIVHGGERALVEDVLHHQQIHRLVLVEAHLLIATSDERNTWSNSFNVHIFTYI